MAQTGSEKMIAGKDFGVVIIGIIKGTESLAIFRESVGLRSLVVLDYRWFMPSDMKISF